MAGQMHVGYLGDDLSTLAPDGSCDRVFIKHYKPRFQGKDQAEQVLREIENVRKVGAL